MAAFARFFEQHQRIIMPSGCLTPERGGMDRSDIWCGLHQVTQVHGIAAFKPGAFCGDWRR